MATVPDPLKSETIVEGMADTEYTEKKRAAFCAVKAAMDMLVAVTEPKCGALPVPASAATVTMGLPKPPPLILPPPPPPGPHHLNAPIANGVHEVSNMLNRTLAKNAHLFSAVNAKAAAAAANSSASSVSASPAVKLTTPAANAVSAANAAANANAAAQANIREQTETLKLFKKQIQEAKNQRSLETINGLLEKKKNVLTELQISQLKALIEDKKKSFKQRKIFSNGPTLARKVQPQPHRPLRPIPNSNLNAESNSNTEPTASGVGQASRRQIGISPPIQPRRNQNSRKVAQQAANALKKGGSRRKTQKRR